MFQTRTLRIALLATAQPSSADEGLVAQQAIDAYTRGLDAEDRELRLDAFRRAERLFAKLVADGASSASLYEIGFNHFFRGKDDGRPGDHVYFQGHAAPGVYARAFLEGRLTEDDLDHFRREIGRGGMGKVHRVHDRNLRRTLAMKVLLDESNTADPIASDASNIKGRITKCASDNAYISWITPAGVWLRRCAGFVGRRGS